MKKAVVLLGLAVLSLVTPARAGKSCVEQSEITGDKTCSRFGSGWTTEGTWPLVLYAGFFTSHVEPAGHRWSGTPQKNASDSFGVAGSQMGIRTVDTAGIDFRFVGYATPFVYLGLDWGFAMGAVDSNVAPTEGYTFRDPKGPDFLHARTSFVTGTRIPLGQVSLRLETLVGLDIVSMSVDVKKGTGDWTRGSISSVGLLIEPRLAADVWTGPWSTISLWAGKNLLIPADHTLGLTFAIHGRAFDGQPHL